MVKEERLAKKKVVKEERLRREMVLRDWLREWPCDGLPAVPALKKPKRDPTAHHCAEQVTAEVRRVLGRSSKAKIKKTKDSQKERQEKRDEAEKMRIRHKEQESLSTKWKPGSRNTTHEDRSGTFLQFNLLVSHSQRGFWVPERGPGTLFLVRKYQPI